MPPLRQTKAPSRDRERDGQPAREQTERGQAEAKRRRRAKGETGRVTRVIDGDTVEIEGAGRVRLIGVDTPERGEECFDEATAYLKDRVGGRTVRYRYQSEHKDHLWGFHLTGVECRDRQSASRKALSTLARRVPRLVSDRR
jgi:endonuclease YncB( thermonuclease family)